MSTVKPFAHKRVTRIPELFSLLRPVEHPQLWRPERSAWIFRGHRNAAWPLIPSLLRQKTDIRLRPFEDQKKIRADAKLLMRRELELILEFCWQCDRYGLPFPDDTYALRTPSEWWRTLDRKLDAAAAGGSPWLPDDMLSRAALAQHYRVPTRLLDWTRDPLIALYHAVTDRSRVHNGYSCIWSLNMDYVLQHWEKPQTNGILIVYAPRSAIPNLHAQRGVLTLDRTVARQGRISPLIVKLDRTIADSRLTKAGMAYPFGPVLRKIEFPASWALTIQRLLDQEDTNAASVYPGYHGVAASCAERSLWRIR